MSDRPEVPTFAINPQGGPDIVVEGSTRFAHERDVIAYLDWSRAEIARLRGENRVAINAIRNTIVALDAHGACQTMADALRFLIGRVDAGGSLMGQWPPADPRSTPQLPSGNGQAERGEVA